LIVNSHRVVNVDAAAGAPHAVVEAILRAVAVGKRENNVLVRSAR